MATEQDYVPITSGTGTQIDSDDLGGVNGGGPYRQRITMADVNISIKNLLGLLANLPLTIDPATGRLRIFIDPLGGAQTLGTITTITNPVTVTFSSINNDATSLSRDIMTDSWANTVRRNIT